MRNSSDWPPPCNCGGTSPGSSGPRSPRSATVALAAGRLALDDHRRRRVRLLLAPAHLDRHRGRGQRAHPERRRRRGSAACSRSWPTAAGSPADRRPATRRSRLHVPGMRLRLLGSEKVAESPAAPVDRLQLRLAGAQAAAPGGSADRTTRSPGSASSISPTRSGRTLSCAG